MAKARQHISAHLCLTYHLQRGASQLIGQKRNLDTQLQGASCGAKIQTLFGVEKALMSCLLEEQSPVGLGSRQTSGQQHVCHNARLDICLGISCNSHHVWYMTVAQSCYSSEAVPCSLAQRTKALGMLLPLRPAA